MKVSIPQAVGVVATHGDYIEISGQLSMVSIPQAVGVVATCLVKKEEILFLMCFNTASGRCCCNNSSIYTSTAERAFCVSIPQAVGVVATDSPSGGPRQG